MTSWNQNGMSGYTCHEIDVPNLNFLQLSIPDLAACMGQTDRQGAMFNMHYGQGT